MLVNIFINVLIVQSYSNQNKVIAVFFVVMGLLNVRQSSHDIQLVASANTQKHTHCKPTSLDTKVNLQKRLIKENEFMQTFD